MSRRNLHKSISKLKILNANQEQTQNKNLTHMTKYILTTLNNLYGCSPNVTSKTCDVFSTGRTSVL